VDGTLEVGEYGIASRFRDQEGNTAFEREQKHVEMIPLYYRLWCPEGPNYALFAIQHFGVHGCKAALERVVTDAMAARYSEYLFQMREVVPQTMISHYMNSGKIKGFSFTHQGIPADWATAYDGSAMDADAAEIEVHIKAKGTTRFSLPQRVSHFFASPTRDARGLFELNNFETEEFKITLDINGRSRVLSHKEFFRTASRLDLNGTVEVDDKGHPKKESIRAIAEKLIAESIPAVAP
jgi:hypothetical protein